MPESYWNETANTNQTKNEIFSQLQAPSETPFFVRLDGRRFQAVAEKLKADKPFDRNFAKCLVASGKTLFQNNLNPALIYMASDEINALFVYTAPFNRRVEKINSVLSGIVSSAFSLCALKSFKKSLFVGFDSRIIVTTREKLVGYLVWRQQDAWRNHNNAYAYWTLRKIGHKPAEATKMLKGIKSEKLHEFLFQQGVNLAKTPAWQRRGILISKQPYRKRLTGVAAIRWRIKENWNLPMFTSHEGKELIRNILEWSKPHKTQKE